MTASLQTQVELLLAYDPALDRTVLRRRKAGGLCHIGKPYWDGQVLMLQLVNPTAGLFAGDELGLNLELLPQARAALTTPSASRYHTMLDGRAVIQQQLQIGAKAWLDFWPEMVIPQANSDTLQRTQIHLEPGAEMVFLDSLAPGRVAHGENYAFRSLETQLDIFQAGERVVRERCLLRPSEGRWPLLVAGWEACYYAAIWIAGPQAEAASSQLAESEWVTRSVLAPELAVIRMVAPSSLLLRAAIREARNDLKRTLPLLATDLRKL